MCDLRRQCADLARAARGRRVRPRRTIRARSSSQPSRRGSPARPRPRRPARRSGPLFARRPRRRAPVAPRGVSSATCPTAAWAAGSASGCSIASAERSLCLFSLVVPPGSKTPIHDHLAWGLVGVYRGNQDEEFYQPRDGGIDLVRRRPLEPGDFYTLLPPVDDVHCVRTTSSKTSVSIDLLANDTGCTERHTLTRRRRAARPFRSGYANAVCQSPPAGGAG